MNRVEENRGIINHFNTQDTKSGTYEKMMIWHLGVISSFLVDISKSLAIIADSMSTQEDKEDVK